MSRTKENRPMYHGKNRTGEWFHNWFVLGKRRSYTFNGTKFYASWLCQCVCGTVEWVDKGNLTMNKTKGCRSCTGNRHSGSSNVCWNGWNHISSSYWNSVVRGAKSRRIFFDITPEYAESLFNGYCALTGDEITLQRNKQTASLNRIDSSKGYIEGNIQWIHKDVNIAKNSISEQRFIDICRKVASTGL